MAASAAYGPALGGAAGFYLRGRLHAQQVAAREQRSARKHQQGTPRQVAVKNGKSANHDIHFRQ